MRIAGVAVLFVLGLWVPFEHAQEISIVPIGAFATVHLSKDRSEALRVDLWRKGAQLRGLLTVTEGTKTQRLQLYELRFDSRTAAISFGTMNVGCEIVGLKGVLRGDELTGTWFVNFAPTESNLVLRKSAAATQRLATFSTEIEWNAHVREFRSSVPCR